MFAGFGESLKGWGCYRVRRDFAIFAAEIRPDTLVNLRDHCSVWYICECL